MQAKVLLFVNKKVRVTGQQTIMVTVHGAHRPSTDRRDIPVPPLETAGLENPAYRAFVVPVNAYQ